MSEARIELWLEEGEEEVEEVNTQAVCDDIPALSENDSEKEEDKHDDRPYPSVQYIGRGFVEVGLINLADSLVSAIARQRKFVLLSVCSTAH